MYVPFFSVPEYYHADASLFRPVPFGLYAEWCMRHPKKKMGVAKKHCKNWSRARRSR